VSIQPRRAAPPIRASIAAGSDRSLASRCPHGNNPQPPLYLRFSIARRDKLQPHLQDFFEGTFFPAFLAFERPMAMACFLLVTFLPLRPDLSWPFFNAFISVLTLFPAAGEYFLPEAFFADDFFAPVLFLVVRFLVEALFLEDLLFFALLDFFLVAFLTAIDFLLGIRC
jgi:hypothetical protein